MSTDTQLFAEIIMPVGSDPGFRLKQDAILRGAFRAGYIPRFPNYEPLQPNFVLEDFVERVRGASVVLADLSDERPSCYYELGVAEATGLTTYLVATTSTDIHQSSVRSRIKFYSTMEELEDVTALLLTASRMQPADQRTLLGSSSDASP